MASDETSNHRYSMFRSWYESLRQRDPKLFEELSSRLRAYNLPSAETVTRETPGETEVDRGRMDVALETLVREGRPALPIREHRISRQDTLTDLASRELVTRLLEAAPAVEPVIPLVGRIDVVNYPGTAKYLGTGWLVDRNIVVTNRHVAELLARREGGQYVFRPGRFGDPVEVSLDYRHEMGSDARTAVGVKRVVWIEPKANEADIAFLEVAPVGEGATPEGIPLALEDAAPDRDVVVIGYPARADADVIPDQAWMDRVYGGIYDVKRIAPGLMGAIHRGWATHDCTTLGGNSGSVVVDMKTGQAVALHFAGLYMIENYAVPASIIRRYLRDRPWHGSHGSTSPPATSGEVARGPATTTRTVDASTPLTPAVAVQAASVSIVIPLKISVSLGQPSLTPTSAPDAVDARDDGARQGDRVPIDAAAQAMWREHRGHGVLAVRPGYVIDQGRLTDRECLVVSAHPARLDAVRGHIPARYADYPVEVRPASLADQLSETGEAVVTEAVTSVSYNDDDRRGDAFSFDWIDEPMTAVLHVGPERSWKVLSDFLARTQRELVSSIYEFHAKHVAAAIERELEDGADLTLVLAYQSRDPKNNRVGEGDFDRSQTFDRWASRYGNRFSRIFVPTGAQGLVAKSYHIKVTVRDTTAVWLSSGNWKRSSQPVIPGGSLDNPGVTNRAGNREWHVVIENDTLATRLRNHILADYEAARELGGTSEAPGDEVMVDVPATVFEALQREGPPAEVLAELVVRRRVRVKPLLTPDQKGGVYSRAVLRLVRSARRQLVFQNQYITLGAGYIEELVEALIEKSRTIDDVRLILRSDVDGFWDNVSELKRRGLDIERCVRRLAKTHTKGIVVDGRQVLMGSHNWSGLGVSLNRDASLIFDDAEIAEYFLRAFDLDWNRAQELVADEAVVREAPRLAEGDTPPPGFIRMPLSEYQEG